MWLGFFLSTERHAVCNVVRLICRCPQIELLPCVLDSARHVTSRVFHAAPSKAGGDEDRPVAGSPPTLVSTECTTGTHVSSLSLLQIHELLASAEVRSSVSNASVAELLIEAAQKLDGAAPQTVIRILQTCTRQSSLDRNALRQFVTSCGQSRVFSKEHLSHQDVVNCVASLAQLHRIARDASFSMAEASHEVLHQLSHHIMSMLETAIDVEHTVKIIDAISVLQFRETSLQQSIVACIESASKLNGLSPTHLACLVHGLSRMGISDYYTLQPLTRLALSEMNFGLFSNATVASLLESAARMQWRNDDIHAKLATEACRRERILRYDGRTFASICLSLGRLSHSCSSDIARLVRHIKQLDRIAQLDARGLSQLALGMHLLDIEDLNLWDQLSQASVFRLRLKNFDEEGLAMVLYSFGSRVQRPIVWEAVSVEILRRRRLSSFRDVTLMTAIHGLVHRSTIPQQPLIAKLFREITTPERLSCLSEENLVGAFVALNRVRWKATTTLRKSGAALSQAILQLPTPSSLSIALTIYTLGGIRCCRLVPKQEITPFVRRALKPDVIDRFTSKLWACLFFGLGELRFHDWRTLDDLLLPFFRTDWSTFNTFEVCNIFFGLGKCGYQRSQVTGPLLEEILRKERRADMDTGILSTLVLSMAYHRIQDKHLLDELISYVLDPARLPTFSKKQLSVILHALTILQYSNRDALEKIIRSLIPVGSRSAMSPEEREQLPWIVHSLGKLRVTDAGIWELLVSELKRDNCEAISHMTPAGLSSVLTALSNTGRMPSDVTARLVETFLTHERVDNGSLMKMLESATKLDQRHVQEHTFRRLLFRCRIKRMGTFFMLRYAESFFRADLLKGHNPYAKGFLTEFLHFRQGMLFSRLTDRRLLQLVASLQDGIDQNYPYLARLFAALKAELFSLRRRDSIRMDDMMDATATLKATEDYLKSNPSTALPVL